jgi:hypothetical protein
MLPDNDHGDVFARIRLVVENVFDIPPEELEYGFMSDDGAFLDRRSAWKHARKSGQLVTDIEENELTSQHLTCRKTDCSA